MLLANPPPPPPPPFPSTTKKRGNGSTIPRFYVYCTRTKVSSQNLEKTRRNERHYPPPPSPRQTTVWSTSGECMLTAWCRRCTSSSGHLTVKPSEDWPWFDSPTLSANYYTCKNGFDIFPLFTGTNGIPLLINVSGGFQLSLVSDGPRGR